MVNLKNNYIPNYMHKYSADNIVVINNNVTKSCGSNGVKLKIGTQALFSYIKEMLKSCTAFSFTKARVILTFLGGFPVFFPR